MPMFVPLLVATSKPSTAGLRPACVDGLMAYCGSGTLPPSAVPATYLNAECQAYASFCVVNAVFDGTNLFTSVNARQSPASACMIDGPGGVLRVLRSALWPSA